MWQVCKVGNKWLLYNQKTGTFIKKFNGKGTKQEAEKECLLRNKMQSL